VKCGEPSTVNADEAVTMKLEIRLALRTLSPKERDERKVV